MTSKNQLDEILARRGIEDIDAFLASVDDYAKINPAEDPDVPVRGSVLLMLRSVVSRAAVNIGLNKLKHL